MLEDVESFSIRFLFSFEVLRVLDFRVTKFCNGAGKDINLFSCFLSYIFNFFIFVSCYGMMVSF
jgi:hypothetical protein